MTTDDHVTEEITCTELLQLIQGSVYIIKTVWFEKQVLLKK